MLEDPGAFGAQLQRDYGDIAHFRLGPISCFQLAHPEHIQQVLVEKAASFRKPSRLKLVFGRIEGNGLVVSDGPYWKQQHNWVRSAVNAGSLQEFAATVIDSVLPLISIWRTRSPIDVCREMRRATLKIIIRTLFSAYDEEQAEQIRLAVEDVQHWAKKELHRVVATPRWMPLVGQPKARRAIATLRKYVRQNVLARRSQDVDSSDVLGRLPRASTPFAASSAASDDRLYDELVTLLLAGHETSAAAITWTLWHVAKHASAQEEIAATVETAVGNRRIEHADLPHLSDASHAVSEAMRLNPPVYLISREVSERVEVAGYELRPGSQVFINLWVTHRDERWYPEPLKFDPGRFTDQAIRTRPKHAYFPFGAGPRACLGRDFAMIEATLIVAMLLQRFRIRPATDQCEPDLEWQLTLHPKGKLLVALDPRV